MTRRPRNFPDRALSAAWMSRSPYRRGAPVLLIGAGIIAVVTAGLGLASRVSSARSRLRDRVDPPSTGSSSRENAEPTEPPTPSRWIKVPVETEPPGASVYRVDLGMHAVLCSPTPCEIIVERDQVAEMVVSLELRGHASARAHVKDVTDVPGGTLMLTFGPRGPDSPPERLRAPKLRQGVVQVNGGLPPEVIQRIVRQNFGRFRLCYENGLRTNPELRGRITTKLTIDASGATTSAADSGSDLPNAQVVSCVVRGFNNLSFPQPEGGPVTAVYPILFDPGD
jgi:hypothetical protein